MCVFATANECIFKKIYIYFLTSVVALVKFADIIMLLSS